MAKALRVVGVVAGAVAIVASGGAAFGLGLAIGNSVISASTIAMVAGGVAGVANLGASALAKPPAARGSVTESIVEVDPPSPYVMGEGYYAGVKRFHKGYGPTLKKVPNPYLAEVYAFSAGGPIEGPMVPQFDFSAVPAWYSGYFEFDSQLGASPESSALVAPYGAPPGWTAAHKLSGVAAALFNHKFDKDGKRYASGLPQRGMHAKWARVYDPRKDSTFPGGMGEHRLGNENTYEWSANPALHAGTYAYGRFQNGKRVMGLALPKEAIGNSFVEIAAWANDCEANGWTMFGVVYEGGAAAKPGQRWANLRDICIAGGGEPMPLNTGIGFHWDRPRVVLDTITEADILGEIDITAMQSWRDRINTIIPQFVSRAHNWSQVPAKAIQNAAYLAEDGEERRETWPFNLVTDPDQVGQLAAYKVANAREFWPLTLPCLPRLRAYRPGDCLQLTIQQNGELVIDTPAVILQRQVDPSTYAVTLTFIGETAAKHAWALGRSAVPPPSPSIGMSAQQRDETAAGAIAAELGTIKLSSSYTRGLAGNITQVHNGAGTGTVTLTIPDHTRVYGDGTEATVEGGTVTLNESTSYLLSYDDPNFTGGEIGADFTIVKINRTAGDAAGDAYFSQAHPSRHYIASVITVNEAGTGGGTGGSSPPGGGGWGGSGGTVPGTEIP